MKISVVGPKGSGKTTLSNYLGSEDAAVMSMGAYAETVGVRIVECERAECAVELWDTGGSTDYESCWPAIMKDTAGVVLVYNPENEGHVAESAAWYDFFVKKNGLTDEQCIVFAFSPASQPGTHQRTSPKLQHLNVIYMTLEDGPMLAKHFDRFLHIIKSFQPQHK